MKSQSTEGILSPFLQKKRFVAIQKFLKKIKYQRILDYGCGDGKLIKFLKKNVKYTGLDINRELIINNKKRYPKANFLNKLGNKKFDVIVLSAVIEHAPDPLKLLRSLKKNLNNKQSIIIITTPNKYFDIFHRIGSFFKIFSQEAADEHNVMFSKRDIYIYAKQTSYEVVKFNYFLLYANQVAVLKSI